MLHVHTRGKGVCGVFTREVAETKVTQVNEFSQHPLPSWSIRCRMHDGTSPASPDSRMYGRNPSGCSQSFVTRQAPMFSKDLEYTIGQCYKQARENAMSS
jgi:hypothetical protein